MSAAITVRAFDAERDLDAWTAIHNQRPVVRGTLQIPFTPTEYWSERFRSARDGRLLVAEIDGQVVGCAGFHVYRGRGAHVGSLGMGVHEAFQGQGVGTALMAAIIDLADNWYNLRRLQLEVYADNEPGVRLYKKFGFEIEGRLRSYAYRDGAYADVYAMARLRDEPPVKADEEDQP